jgi:hypothetical protein
VYVSVMKRSIWTNITTYMVSDVILTLFIEKPKEKCCRKLLSDLQKDTQKWVLDCFRKVAIYNKA